MPQSTDCKARPELKAPTQSSALLSSDEPLIVRDRAMPGLRAALNPAILLERVHALAPHSILASGAAELCPYYVRYKPMTNCVVAYRVRLSGEEPTFLYARASSEADQHVSFSDDTRATGRLGFGILHDQSLQLTIRCFPNDAELDAISHFSIDDNRRRLLSKLMPDRDDLHDAALHILRYKPERRCVMRLGPEDERGVTLKFYIPEDYDRAKANLSKLRRKRPVLMPQVLGRNKRRGVIAHAWMPGWTLDQHDLSGTTLVETMRSVGEALAGVHRMRSALPHQAQIPNLHEAAAAIETLLPSLASQAHRLARALASTQPVAATSVIHGDFSPEQILLTTNGLALLDFDRAGMGDPRQDFGRFAAKHYLARCATPDAAAHTQTVMQALLDGYAQRSGKRGSDQLQWKWFAAAELFRIAVEPFRTRQSNWPQLIEQALSQAERWSSND